MERDTADLAHFEMKLIATFLTEAARDEFFESLPHIEEGVALEPMFPLPADLFEPDPITLAHFYALNGMMAQSDALMAEIGLSPLPCGVQPDPDILKDVFKMSNLLNKHGVLRASDWKRDRWGAGRLPIAFVATKGDSDVTFEFRAEEDLTSFGMELVRYLTKQKAHVQAELVVFKDRTQVSVTATSQDFNVKPSTLSPDRFQELAIDAL